MKDLNDLVGRFSKGEASAYKGIFDYYYKDIFYFAWKMLGSKEDAEDLTIQIFSKLFERHADFNTAPNIKAFLFITIRNACLNFLRDKKYETEMRKKFAAKMENDYRLSLEYSVKSDLLEAVQIAINNLPETYRRIFRLLILEERKPSEVAALLDISLDNVYQQKKRALQMLRLRLDDKALILTAFFYLACSLPKKI
jgi:RNA polymerase sigma-70 factor (family 1)